MLKWMRLHALLISASVALLVMGGMVAYSLDRDGELSDAASNALALSDDSSVQSRILSDGVVTPEEHMQAVTAAAACIREQGFDARVEGDKNPTIGVYGLVSRDVVRACQVAHLDAVAFAWADQIRPSEAGYRTIHEVTTTCFRSRGGQTDLPVLGWAEIQRILTSGTADQRAALGPCLMSNREEFGVPY